MGDAPPTLVIWCKEDEVIPHSHSQNLPVAQGVVFDNAVHMAYMEKASDVNALIKQHIDGGDLRGRAVTPASWPGLTRPSSLVA